MNNIPNSASAAKAVDAPHHTLTPAAIAARYGVPHPAPSAPVTAAPITDRELFEVHFPDTGRLCLAYDRSLDRKPSFSEFFDQWDDFWNRSDTLVAAGHSVFVSPSVFVDDATRRMNEQVQVRKNLAIDIDVHPSGKKDGTGNPCFRSAQEAIATLNGYCQTHGLKPPNMNILSGSGLHCWWLFDQPLAPNEWSKLASDFKRALLAIDPRFGADTSRWTDLSGVLRPPGSINRKPGYGPTGIEVTLERGHDSPWPIADIAGWCAGFNKMQPKALASNPATNAVKAVSSGLMPSLKGKPVAPDRLRSALDYLAANGLAASVSNGGEWANILLSIAGAAKVGEISSDLAEELMRSFSKLDIAAYEATDGGAESEKRLAHMLANATGDRSAGSIFQQAKDLGWVDPGEPSPFASTAPHLMGAGIVHASGLSLKLMENVMRHGIAQTDELLEIMAATPTVQKGHLAYDTAAHVLRIYANGLWHALPSPDNPQNEGACRALNALKAEVMILAREVGEVEEQWATRWMERALDYKRIQNGVSDDTEVEPGCGVTIGMCKALAHRLGKAASPGKVGANQRAELRRKRTEFISGDGFSKVWKRLGNLPQLRRADFGNGTINNRRAVIVGADYVLRDDGSLGVFDPRYLATCGTDYFFNPPDRDDVHQALMSPEGWLPPYPQPRAFVKVLKHVCNDDTAVMAYVLSLIGAKLIGKETGQKALAFIGAPASGKSLTLKALERALGNLVKALSKNILAGSQRDDTRIASLMKEKPKFLTCGEFQDFSGRTDWALFKEIVGGDTVNARIAYQQSGTDGRFNALLLLASNGLPPMADDVAAVIRRVDAVNVPAHRRLKGTALDTTLEASVMAEAPEIARLLVFAGLRFNASNPRPAAFDRAAEVIDPSWGPKVRQWLAEATQPDPAGHESITGLKLSFDQWCRDALAKEGNIKSEELTAAILEFGNGAYSKGRKRPVGVGAKGSALASIIGLRFIQPATGLASASGSVVPFTRSFGSP